MMLEPLAETVALSVTELSPKVALCAFATVLVGRADMTRLCPLSLLLLKLGLVRKLAMIVYVPA